MFRILLAGLVAAAAATPIASAQEQDGLLPVEQAFVLRAEIREPGRIALHWDIAKDYYLYKSRISAKTGQAGTVLEAIDVPARKVKEQKKRDKAIDHLGKKN